ncbi:hypothetical protein [Mesoterricola silvestris]|uniref:Uncharacterized protein n=1 Tax=Mesoterricola silvestris TaxID=2927979 RepID=A0AA48K8Q6_9BACT|nr:hypothetical protein [Mesoterricola silvestris]BDU72365.1 hypothetical protein METEAL_15390 [Mesoterricola silvestris]
MIIGTKFTSDDIEPGMVFQGDRGQVREVVKIAGLMVRFKVLSLGATRSMLGVGSCEWVEMRSFLNWAQEDITEKQRAS